MEGTGRLAQHSFVGFMPRLVIAVKDGELTFLNPELDEETKVRTSDPIEDVSRVLKERALSGGFRFAGGAVGYISYDAIRYWEKIPEKAVDDLKLPDLELGIYDDGVVFDHTRGEIFYFYRGKSRFDRLLQLLKRTYNPGLLSFSEPESNVSKEKFEDLVREAKHYIDSGDIFQVVLSRRYDFKVNGDLTRFYLNLREINPSPYMYFLKMGERKIVGSSPEMLVRVEGRTVETFPIAGTRPRTGDPEEDRRLAEELLSDPKERAEHVMLVDLARNDLGKVSKLGSVRVTDFMKVHRYSHVQHIVSRVIGELKRENDCHDAFKAVFPAGTVSGAPKIRAMEIIEELEPVRRGPYAGAVGYLSYNGNADFAITIRTLVATGRTCSIQVGAGIVADSIPEREWFETEHKAKALMKALEESEDKR